MVEQQELNIDGSGDADDKIQFSNGDSESGATRVNASSTLRDADETAELLNGDNGGNGGKSGKSKITRAPAYTKLTVTFARSPIAFGTALDVFVCVCVRCE